MFHPSEDDVNQAYVALSCALVSGERYPAAAFPYIIKREDSFFFVRDARSSEELIDTKMSWRTFNAVKRLVRGIVELA